VLAATGLSMPATQLAALIRFLPLAFFLWLRGLRFRERPVEQIPAADLLRIDTYWAVALSLSFQISSVWMVGYFHKQNLRLALRAGEPYRVLRALVFEELIGASARGGDAPTRSAAELERIIASLIERLSASDARFAVLEGVVAMSTGVRALYRCRFREAREHLAHAVSRHDGNDVRVANEYVFSGMFLLQALYALGEWKEMSRRRAAFLEEARARGDLFFEIEMAKFGHLPALMEDRPDKARDAVSHVEALWLRAYPSGRFTLLAAYAMTALYRDAGAGDGALRIVKELWPALARSGLLIFSQLARTELLYVRGSAHVAAAVTATPRRQTEMLRAAERDARTLARLRTRVATGYSACLRAGAAASRGDREQARVPLAEAQAAFEQAEMALNAAVCRRRLGELAGGEEGRAQAASADAAMEAQGIRNPARMTAMFLPGAW
jgi:hypothetical protein